MLKNWWFAIAAAVLLVGGAALAVLPSGDAREDDPMVLVGREDARNGRMSFRMEGRPVRHLYPGAVRQMRVTVINPYDFRLQLSQIAASPQSSSHRGCSATAENIVIKHYTGRLPITIAPQARVRLDGTLPVSMPRGAAQQCAGALFTIAVSALGKRVSR